MTDRAAEPLILLKETSTDGRYVVAGKDIAAGSLVHMSLPYVLTMHPQSAQTRCRCCFGPIDLRAREVGEGGISTGRKSSKSSASKNGRASRATKPLSQGGIASHNATHDHHCVRSSCSEGCAAAWYCSKDCEAIYHDFYHVGSTNTVRTHKSYYYYGEECKAAYIINTVLGDKVKKGRQSLDVLFLTLFVSVFLKAEAEARAAIAKYITGECQAQQCQVSGDSNSNLRDHSQKYEFALCLLKGLASEQAVTSGGKKEEGGRGGEEKVVGNSAAQPQAAIWLNKSPSLIEVAQIFGAKAEAGGATEEKADENSEEQPLTVIDAEEPRTKADTANGDASENNQNPSIQKNTVSSDRAFAGTAHEPAEVGKIAAAQTALGRVQVADPMFYEYLSRFTSLLDTCTSFEDMMSSKRLQAAMGAVTAFSNAELLKGSSLSPSSASASASVRAPSGGYSDLKPSSAPKKIPSTTGNGHLGGPFLPTQAGMNEVSPTSFSSSPSSPSSSSSCELRNAITPTYADLAAIVSNRDVIPKDRMGDYKSLYHLYNRIRRLLGFGNQRGQDQGEDAADASSIDAVPRGGDGEKLAAKPVGKNTTAVDGKAKKGKIKPGTNVSNSKKKLLLEEQKKQASATNNNKKKRSNPFGSDDDDDDSDFDADTFDAVVPSKINNVTSTSSGGKGQQDNTNDEEDDLVPDAFIRPQSDETSKSTVTAVSAANSDPHVATKDAADTLSAPKSHNSTNKNEIENENDNNNLLLFAKQALEGFNKDPLFLPEVSEVVFTSVCAGLQCNGFGVYDQHENCTAIGLYPFASYFNHSCDPNICRLMVGNEMRFFALRDIPEGEPLCISYVDIDEQTAERRKILLKTYRFYCRCSRCAGGGKLQCLECDKCDAKGYLRPLLVPPRQAEQQNKQQQGSPEEVDGAAAVGTFECTICRALHTRDK